MEYQLGAVINSCFITLYNNVSNIICIFYCMDYVVVFTVWDHSEKNVPFGKNNSVIVVLICPRSDHY